MRRFKLGTRGSPLAMAQAHETRARIGAALGVTGAALDERVEIVVIKTTGDRIQDRPLAEAGGKGLFVKELEEALYDGRVDLAVHSMKDVPGELPPGFVIAGALPREDARDALLGVPSFEELPEGARIGTTSPRRAAQLLSMRPDFRIVLFRGNVQTRLDKLVAGEAEATLLAMAGINRLGLNPALTPLDPDLFIPAAGQGVVGLEIRADDEEVLFLAQAVTHEPSAVALAAERACLAALDGSCRSAIGIHAGPGIEGGYVIRAAVFALDGTRREDALETLAAPPTRAEATAIGQRMGLDLKSRSLDILNALS